LSSFDAVSWNAVGEFEIEQTGREELTIEAEPEVVALTRSEVRNGRLWIGFGPGRVQTNQPIRFHLQVKSLRSIESMGSGSIRVGPLSVDSLSMELRGSEMAELRRLQANSLDVRLRGAGQLQVAGGRVDAQRVSLEGAGDYVALGLASRRAEVSILGAGRVGVSASERLVAKIAGSGDLRYRGDPQVSSEILGAGRVMRESL
jgi:hypothetical protein